MCATVNAIITSDHALSTKAKLCHRERSDDVSHQILNSMDLSSKTALFSRFQGFLRDLLFDEIGDAVESLSERSARARRYDCSASGNRVRKDRPCTQVRVKREPAGGVECLR